MPNGIKIVKVVSTFCLILKNPQKLSHQVTLIGKEAAQFVLAKVDERFNHVFVIIISRKPDVLVLR